jgi:catechol 2,3-dioxygenase-like lactoylglutathione lyase family enzyme
MSIRALKPFIPSSPDFDAAKAFFRDLGFAVNRETEGLAELQLGGATFLLQDFHNQELQRNLMMFVSVDNLDDWRRSIRLRRSGPLPSSPGKGTDRLSVGTARGPSDRPGARLLALRLMGFPHSRRCGRESDALQHVCSWSVPTCRRCP